MRDRVTRVLAVAGVAVAIAAVAAGVGPVLDQVRSRAAPAAVTGTVRPATTWPPMRPPAGHSRPVPVRPLVVTVPAIGVQSRLVPLRLDRAGALQPPQEYGRAGWYAGGPTPGDPGPAVIAGHVDSRAGPAIFFRLRELRPGDSVVVTRSDGRTARFRVVGVDRYPKNRFPTQRVYGPTPDRALRLITCGGSFDYARRSYRDNVVAYALAA